MLSGPAPRNSHPFAKIAVILLPLISLWNYPAYQNKPHHIWRSFFSHLLIWPTFWLWSVSLKINQTHHFVSHWFLSLLKHQEQKEKNGEAAPLSPETRLKDWVQDPICITVSAHLLSNCTMLAIKPPAQWVLNPNVCSRWCDFLKESRPVQTAWSERERRTRTNTFMEPCFSCQW